MTTRHVISVNKKLAILILFIMGSCSTKQNNQQHAGTEQDSLYKAMQVQLSEDKESLRSYYQLEHIKEWYPERILPPPFDFTISLEGLSVVELWLLRNEIYARNGYLFDDAVLRGHFNSFKWYQPVFDVPDFKVQLTSQEQAFIEKVMAKETALVANRYQQVGAYKMIDMAHVYNVSQFQEIPVVMRQALTEKNFAIIPAAHAQLFHVYDKNHYEYIPNFITTDLYLQVLHKHLSSVLRKIEEEKLIEVMSGLLRDMYHDSIARQGLATSSELAEASEWTTTYLAIAHSLISGEPVAVPEKMERFYKNEMEKITTASGSGSDFLSTPRIFYNGFNPRGNYTRTATLEKYFRCIKWLNTAPILIDDRHLLSALLLGSIIKNNPANVKRMEYFNSVIRLVAGEEDNLSMSKVVSIITREEADNPAKFTQGRISQIRDQLLREDVNRIFDRNQNDPAGRIEPFLLFSAGRYAFDNEILIRLVHTLRPHPKRPFPKGLDVFAVMGNAEAERILLEDYKEAKIWQAYPDTLAVLKKQFKNSDRFDENLFAQTFRLILSLEDKGRESSVCFAGTHWWERKNLNTALAAWTELKHDMLLYSEQPNAAQAGQGGGPPPPMHISYVEPNVSFWHNAIELLSYQEKELGKMQVLTPNIRSVIDELKQIAGKLLVVSRKQLERKPVSKAEFEFMSYIGGQIEYLTFRIFETTHLPEKERLIGLVADVYNNNGAYLIEGVGMADEIYVTAEINGKPYITRGAVFSYYEFTSSAPVTDEQWQTSLSTGDAPRRPEWTDEMIIHTNPLKTKAHYSF
jgi:hypothetical protein